VADSAETGVTPLGLPPERESTTGHRSQFAGQLKSCNQRSVVHRCVPSTMAQRPTEQRTEVAHESGKHANLKNLKNGHPPLVGPVQIEIVLCPTAVTRARYVRRGGRNLSEDGEAIPRG
jgi:hypothetical protein